MDGNSKVFNPYEKYVFLQISSVFKTPGMKKLILDYTINKAVCSLRLVLAIIRQSEGYRDLPSADKAFEWSFKSLKEFINEYPIIRNSLHYETHDAIATNKLVVDINSIANIFIQLSKRCDPKSITTYQTNQLDQILEDLQSKYEDSKEKFYEVLIAKEGFSAPNPISNMCSSQASDISENTNAGKLNDTIIEHIKYHTSLALFSNTVEIAETRLSMRKENLQRNLKDAEQSINIAKYVHNYKMDFDKRGIEKYAREIERYTKEFVLKVEDLNDKINVTKFRLREYRKLNQTLITHLNLYDQAIAQYKERESQQQASETESEIQENLETLLEL